jgi:hypothetical protein
MGLMDGWILWILWILWTLCILGFVNAERERERVCERDVHTYFDLYLKQIDIRSSQIRSNKDQIRLARTKEGNDDYVCT